MILLQPHFSAGECRAHAVMRPAGGVRFFLGLVLQRVGTRRLRRRHEHELSWPHHWIDWPDFLLPRDRDHAIHHIRALHDHARADHQVEVACSGGIGRTGTIIVCRLLLSRYDQEHQ
ncbi:MAG: protein-tyrosine phosphatase family protein [Pseudonocardiaceae bacterium]